MRDEFRTIYPDAYELENDPGHEQAIQDRHKSAEHAAKAADKHRKSEISTYYLYATASWMPTEAHRRLLFTSFTIYFTELPIYLSSPLGSPLK